METSKFLMEFEIIRQKGDSRMMQPTSQASRSYLVMVLIAAVAFGCAATPVETYRYLEPQTSDSSQLDGDVARGRTFIKEQNNIEVSVLAVREEPAGLLGLAVSISNKSDKKISFFADNVDVVSQSGNNLSALDRSEILMRKYGQKEEKLKTQALTPYTPIFMSVMAMASFLREHQPSNVFIQVLENRSLRDASIGGGEDLTGFRYYDAKTLSGPVRVIIQVESEKFEFELA
jgi:hypothetical protein